MIASGLLGWIILRVLVAYVYLYALYLNTHDVSARAWFVSHTAYLFSSISEPHRTIIARLFALSGALMMFFGGLSLLLGVEPRAGALMLFVFTGVGIYQHRCERKIAMEIANMVEPHVKSGGEEGFTALKWSAYSGQLSSGLKNWALCGIFVAIIIFPVPFPSGPMFGSDFLGSLIH
jgi:uncharacterized membrane protein YphA (DoxX/SURF4 family)